jgi:hypothetical protein
MVGAYTVYGRCVYCVSAAWFTLSHTQVVDTNNDRLIYRCTGLVTTPGNTSHAARAAQAAARPATAAALLSEAQATPYNRSAYPLTPLVVASPQANDVAGLQTGHHHHRHLMMAGGNPELPSIWTVRILSAAAMAA